MTTNDFSFRKLENGDNNGLSQLSLLFQETDQENYRNFTYYTPYDYYSEWSSAATHRANHFWIAEDKVGEIQGVALLKYKNVVENPTIGRADLRIRQKSRRKGIATELIFRLAYFSKAINRTNLIVSSNSSFTASSRFMVKIDAKFKDSTIERHLDLSYYTSNCQEGSSSYEKLNDCSFWQGNLPNNFLNDLSIVKHFLDDRPSGARSKTNWQYSEEWNSQEQKIKNLVTNDFWTFILYDKLQAIGYCEIEFYKMSNIAYFVEIGIHPDYRKKGLARNLKNLAINKIINDKPLVKYVKVLNSSSNEPVCKLNERMGFKTTNIYSKWNIDINSFLKKS